MILAIKSRFQEIMYLKLQNRSFQSVKVREDAQLEGNTEATEISFV